MIVRSLEDGILYMWRDGGVARWHDAYDSAMNAGLASMLYYGVVTPIVHSHSYNHWQRWVD